MNTRRKFLALGGASAAAAAGALTLSPTRPAAAASQAGPLEITGADTHVALIGPGVLGDYGVPQSEPSVYRAGTDRLGVRARSLVLSPWATDLNHVSSGDFSALLVLARDTVNNDNSILFCSVKEPGTGADKRETQWAIEQAGDKHLVVKDVHSTVGDGANQDGVFTMRMRFEYPPLSTNYCNISTHNSNFGVFDNEGTFGFGGGRCVFAMHAAEVEPSSNLANGAIIYVDAAGNLKCRTKAGNVRTIAAV